MIKIPGDRTVFCDVDDTLLMWNPSKEDLEARGISVHCPGSLCTDEDGVISKTEGFTERLLPHRKHVEQLIKHKMRGHTIVVWSAGGVDWAEAAVKALFLTNIVDVVMSKPAWAYDDLQPNEFIKVQWLKDE